MELTWPACSKLTDAFSSQTNQWFELIPFVIIQILANKTCLISGLQNSSLKYMCIVPG